MKCARGFALALGGWTCVVLSAPAMRAQAAGTQPAAENPAAPPPAPVRARQVLTVPIITQPGPGSFQPANPPPPAPTPPANRPPAPAGANSGGRTSIAVPTVPAGSAWGGYGASPGSPHAPQVPSAAWSPASPPALAPSAQWPQPPSAHEDIPLEELLNEINLPRLNVVNSRYYEITGPDFPSAQAVKTIAEKMPDALGDIYAWPRDKVRRIQIQLVPSAMATFSEPFILQDEYDGHRAALIRWDARTSFSDTCMAVGAATVERLATWNSGPAAGARTPVWLKLAAAQALEAAMRPAYNDGLSEQAQFMPVFTLRQIMTAGGAQPPDVRQVLAVNAYWLMKFLQEQTGGGPRAVSLFAALAAGAEPDQALRTAFPNKFPDPATMELWWSLGYREIVARRSFPIQTLTQSHELLTNFTSLEQTVAGSKQSGPLDAGWAARRNAQVVQQIRTRLADLPNLLKRVNPVYRNALMAAGQCVLTLQGNDEALFRAAWKKYLEELRTAEAIETHVLNSIVSP